MTALPDPVEYMAEELAARGLREAEEEAARRQAAEYESPGAAAYLEEIVGEAEVKKAIAALEETPPVERPSEVERRNILRHLAGLGPLKRDAYAGQLARLLGAPVATVRREVAALAPREEVEARGGLQGRSVMLRDPEPWPEPVDGVELLTELVETLRRFIVLPEGAAEAIALWVVHTHAFQAFETTGYLAALSPVKRCGKSRVLQVLEALVPRPLLTSNISEAALFRVVEEHHPALLIDEAETFASMRDELRGILNSGNAITTAKVTRCVGDDHEPRTFSVWCPKAYAMIGRPPDTIEDRSIIIPMKRRAPHEVVERFRFRQAATLRSGLCRRIARWAVDNLDALKGCEPELPEELSDRQQDCWEPLLAIADMVGGGWPERARRAALALSGVDVEEADARVQLLEDLQIIFERSGRDRLPTTTILEELHTLEDRPWSEWSHGRPLTARGLSRLLAPFGVKPRYIRTGDDVSRGYFKADLEDAFARYRPISRLLSVTSVTSQVRPQIRCVTSKASVTDENRPLTCNVTDVTDGNPEKGERTKSGPPETPNSQPELEASEEAQASLEEIIPPGPPEVLAEEPFRIEWRPACRSLAVETGAGIPPWEFILPDPVTARLPLQGYYRIYFVGSGKCWQTDSDVFWEHAEMRPTGSLLPELGLWQELDPAGVGKTRDDPPGVKL